MNDAATVPGRLSDQVALITGGGTGIGAATARRLAAEGARVAVIGRRLKPLAQVAAAIGDRRSAMPVSADAASADEMAAVIEQVGASFGPVSILVANAGGEGGGTAAEVSNAAWRRSMRANLDTCLVTARACLPDLITTGGSAVVVSSLAGLAASPESVGYVTAKHALIGLTRSIARDFGPRGVRVNAVCPGWIRTPMADAEMDQLAALRGLPDREAAYQLATSQVPLRRPCSPDEVGDGRTISAEAAVHLPQVVPTKIIAVHLNHRSRVAEFGATLPPAPTYFQKPTSALVGHGGAVVRPANCQYLNYEGEIAIVIGRTCRNVAQADVGAYLAGYTVANDFGLHDFRDTDAGSMLRVKGSNTMAPLGPGLVTDWDFRGKGLRTYVNGTLVQDLSGTPANSRPVKPGDVVEVEADGLGLLRNHVAEGPLPVSVELGAQPSESEEVVSTALGGDWEFRGIRPPRR